MMNLFKDMWLRMPIEKKNRVYSITIIGMVLIIGVFNLFVVIGSIKGLGLILSDLSKCENVQTAFEDENDALEKYLHSGLEETKQNYESACVHTRACINRLPYTYSKIGAERFARTWRVMNAYDYYNNYRKEHLQEIISGESPQQLYDLYDMQSDISTYVQDLTKITVQEGSISYEDRVTVIDKLPIMLIFITILALFITIGVGRILTYTVMHPIKKIADNARSISENNFDTEDITVSNKDELGELVCTFNNMKHTMSDHINTLHENQRLTDQIHKDEVEKIEMERQLNVAQLQLLQSQINPHFLFNTLNMISGMAELESAETTQKMINSLSHLFRYNLKTTDHYVSLSQEIKIIDDYMYLQKMRFGSRLEYNKEIEEGVDTDGISVPAFLLQPLVENSIIHGISSKEEGGSVSLIVHRDGEDKLIIEVKDTGVGIPPDVLSRINSGESESSDDHAGIGLSNVYKRIIGLYDNSDVKVESIEDKGTTVKICIRY